MLQDFRYAIGSHGTALHATASKLMTHWCSLLWPMIFEKKQQADQIISETCAKTATGSRGGSQSVFGNVQRAPSKRLELRGQMNGWDPDRLIRGIRFGITQPGSRRSPLAVCRAPWAFPGIEPGPQGARHTYETSVVYIDVISTC